MKLYGTYPSPFTRKVRIVCAELGLSYDFSPITQLMETGQEHFAGNPLHLIPVLELDKEQIFESDIICEYLIERFGKGKALSSFLPTPHEQKQKFTDLKRLAISNGAMNSGVKIIRAQRAGIPDFDKYVFFRQERAAIQAALAWLDNDLDGKSSYYPNEFTLLDINLACLLDWAIFRELIPGLKPWPNLEKFSLEQSARESLQTTHPIRGA